MNSLTNHPIKFDGKQILRSTVNTVFVFFLLACVFTLMVSCASHTASSSTIAEATAAPDGAQVVVTGEVVQQVDSEHMVVRDNSGQINVEVDKDILGKVKFAPDSRLRILGKMDRNSDRSLLVAKSVQVVQQ
jgi:uncharacterized protein (TIGR00156 family)